MMLNGLAVAIVLCSSEEPRGIRQQYLMVGSASAVMDLRVALYGKSSRFPDLPHKRRSGNSCPDHRRRGAASGTGFNHDRRPGRPDADFFGMAGFLIYLNWKLTVFALS
jgi:hypothetical protein